MSRTFTLDEAQTVLPVLGALLNRAREAAVRAGTLEGEMNELTQRIFLSGGLHVDVSAAARCRAAKEKAVSEARDTLGEIEQIGANVADFGEGQLELPSLLDGRAVLLCWTLGDPEIERWREAEEGSAMQPIRNETFGRERDRPN